MGVGICEVDSNSPSSTEVNGYNLKSTDL